MAKDTFYFQHDYNARNDEKIVHLLSDLGYEGYGVYWAIVEELYNNKNRLKCDYKVIAFNLRCNEDIVKKVVEQFDLFKIKDEFFFSSSIKNRLRKREEKARQATDAANKRWHKKRNASASNQQCENDAKERKGNKGKEIKEKREIEAVQNSHSETQIKSFQEFNNWLKKNAPRVLKMKEPITIDQYLKLGEEYKPFNPVLEKLSDMHNHEPLLKKNVNANLTLRNWLRKDDVLPGEAPANPTKEPTYLEQALANSEHANV